MNRWILPSICVLLAVSSCRQFPEPHSERNGSLPVIDITIPLEPYFHDLRLVRLPAGPDTLGLLFDTGGGATLITPRVAALRGCQPHGADVGNRMNGEVVVFARCDSLRLSSGAWSASLAPVGVFDFSHLLPPELPRLDGVLALDAFAAQVLTVDWTRGLLILHSAESADSALLANSIALRAGTGESGRFLQVLARVEGTREPLWFLLDSGNLAGTLVARSILRDSLLPLRAPDTALLRVGGRPAVAVSFHAHDLILDGALGTDYFRRGPITLDLRHMPAGH